MEAASYHYHGSVIREARQAAHMTQEQLAEVWPKADGGVGVSWHYVQGVEYGKRRIDSTYTLRELAKLLAIPLWKFGLSDYDPFDPQHASEQSKSALAGGDQSNLHSAQLELHAVSETPTMHEEGDIMDTFTRRQALEVGAELGATALLLPPIPNADEADRLSWIFEDAKALDVTALASLEQITDSYWHLLYSGVPKGRLLQGVLGHLATIKQFLHTAQPTAQEQRLSALVSQQAQMAGNIYYDMHDYPQAEQYYKLGIEIARQAGNPTLYAVAVARTSFVYSYSHQYQEALSLLRVARRFAEQSPTIYYWIAAQEARVHARLYALHPEPSRAHASLQALEEAEQRIEQPDEVPTPYGRRFGLGDLLGEKGGCFRYLGRSADAQAILLEALTTRDKVLSDQAITLVDLGSVYAQQGEIEEACTRATQALMIINQTASANTLQRVVDFRQELAPWASSSEVQKLDEHIMVVRLQLVAPSLTKKE